MNKEYNIGEIFEFGGEWYQCVKVDCCRNCDFYDKFKDDICFLINNCSLSHRSDKTSVIFKKLKKVGETYDDYGTILQRFKIYTNVTNADTKGLELHIYSDDTIGIELKQNKEDMKENRKLKPFDLEVAKAGKPVCTRDGRKARIICFDKQFSEYPIISLVQDSNCKESIYYHDTEGKSSINPNLDLMMLPEKRSGWAKVRKDINLYDTKEEADRKMIGNDEYVTAKVFWEE